MANECPAMRVRQISRILSNIFDEELRPLGLQLSQLPVLVGAAMCGERGVQIGKLAGAMVMDPTTLTRKVRPLERSKLVRLVRDPDDARARRIVLTPSGQRMLEDALPLWKRAKKRAEAHFGAGTLADLRANLAPIVERFGGHTGGPIPGDPRRGPER